MYRILCGWHFCKDGLMHNTIPNIFSNMKSVLIFLLSVCCIPQLYTQSSLLPSRANLSQYQKLEETNADIPTIRKAKAQIDTSHPDLYYFDYLEMQQHVFQQNWHAVDSLYNRLTNHFSLQNNKIILSRLHSMYGTALNAKGEYKQSTSYLLSLIEKTASIKDESKFIPLHQESLGAMYYELAFGSMNLQKLDDANTYIHTCTEILQQTADTALLTEAYNLAGVLFNRMGMPENAIKKYKQAYELNSHTTNTQLGRLILQNIATLYSDMFHFDKALEFSRKIYSIFPVENQLNLRHRIEYIHTLNTTAVIQLNCKMPKNALDTLGLALKLIQPEIPQDLKFLVYNTFARASFETNNLNKTKQALDSAHYYLSQVKYPKYICDFHCMYARYLWKTNNNTLAEKHFLKAYSILDQNIGIGKIGLLKTMSAFYAENGRNYQLAYRYATEMHQTFLEEQAQKYKQHITSYEVEFKTKEKEAELALLHELRKQEQLSFHLKTIIAIFTIILCVLIILLLVMILRRHSYNFNLRELKLRQEIDEQYISGLEHSNQHMAKELHDGVCNQLLALELSCTDINPIVATHVNSIRKEIRFISHTLASPEFFDISLKQILDDYFKKLQTLEQVKIHYYTENFNENIHLSNIQQREIYRIIQEALSNIYKHAKATDIYITISLQNKHLYIIVEDNGCGFDSYKLKEGYGLHSMKSRAHNIQANLFIESQQGNGTIVTLSIPL